MVAKRFVKDENEGCVGDCDKGWVNGATNSNDVLAGNEYKVGYANVTYDDLAEGI